MNKLFASLLIVIYVAMSAVAHGTPHQVLQNVEQSDRNLATNACLDNTDSLTLTCNGMTKKTTYCDSSHCAFHFVFLSEATAENVYDAGHNHLIPPDIQLVALLWQSKKKPPRFNT
ncbi:hypothetical protein MNBD_ALPHA08-2241 [hydrothermal vent metagenome]|uniref:Uncharacterized protein n=1 Tax=hydrothermal vent metagenome TaxID=652676 RepID=A0A3B0SCJ8_9ZZZZ